MEVVRDLNNENEYYYQEHEHEGELEEEIANDPDHHGHIASEINTVNSPVNCSEYIKSYSSIHKLYGVSFQSNKSTIRLGLSTLETNNTNRIEVVEYDQLNDRIKRVSHEETEFPCSKVMWSPSEGNNSVLAAPNSSDSSCIFSGTSSPY